MSASVACLTYPDHHNPLHFGRQVASDWPVTVVWGTPEDRLLPAKALDSSSLRPTLVPAGRRRRHFDLVLPALERPGGEDGCKWPSWHPIRSEDYG